MTNLGGLIDLQDLRPVLPASTVILGAAFFLCWSGFRVSGHRFFLWLAIAWLSNLAYLMVEAIERARDHSGSELAFWSSLPTTYCFLLAALHLRIPDPASRLRVGTAHLLAWTVALLVPRLLGTIGSQGFDITLIHHGPGIVFSTFALVYLAWCLVRLSPIEALDLVVSRSVAEQDPDDDQHKTNSDRKDTSLQPSDEILSTTRTATSLIALGLVVYGLLQVTYLFLHSSSVADVVALPFYVALGAKTFGIFGIALLLYAGYRFLDGLSRRFEVLTEIGALTASLEHDIRAPLSVVRQTVAQLLERTTNTDSERKALELANQKLEIATAAVEIIPSFRETATYYRDRSMTNNLVDLVRTAVREAKAKFAGDMPRIEIDDHFTVLHVSVYAPRIVQALTNVLTNAIEALTCDQPQRGPSIHIRFDIGQPIGMVTVRIHDNGPGMTTETARRATQPAFSTKNKGSANRGMGLYIARRIIEGHAGRFGISSSPGEFTEVSIALPLEGIQRRARRA